MRTLGCNPSIKSDYIALRNVANLRNLRISMGASLNMIAENTGVSGSTISIIERSPDKCTPLLYEKLAAIFNWEPFVFNRQREAISNNDKIDATLPLPLDAMLAKNTSKKIRSRADLTITLPFDMKNNLKAWATNHHSDVSHVVELAVNLFFHIKNLEDNHDAHA